ncbi:MAG: hypothetical protein KAS97_10795, partial [Candidatus Aminicenantes bacterium]|nr:hypothetical protein [Candidatus Aminicenantes bacterium]
ALNQASDLFLVSNSIHYQKFVELIGSASGASRTYIFVNHFNEKEVLLTSQVAEFCSEGIESEINNPELQNLPFNTWGKRWEKTLSE